MKNDFCNETFPLLRRLGFALKGLVPISGPLGVIQTSRSLADSTAEAASFCRRPAAGQGGFYYQADAYFKLRHAADKPPDGGWIGRGAARGGSSGSNGGGGEADAAHGVAAMAAAAAAAAAKGGGKAAASRRSAYGELVKGYCDTTDEDDEGDCERGAKGSWALRSAPSTWHAAALQCAARCAGCARCHNISVSASLLDCSWFAACPKVKLNPAFRSAAVRKMSRIQQHRTTASPPKLHFGR